MLISTLELIDAGCKAVTAVAIPVGGWWSIRKYFRARMDEARTASFEAKKPFLAKRLDLYVDAVTAAADVAMAESQLTNPSGVSSLDGYEKNPLNDATARFYRLYFGPLTMVEDDQVAIAMARFYTKLKNGGAREDLEQLALDLARTCRDSIGAEWDVQVAKNHGVL
jgi:hypothetical protein